MLLLITDTSGRQGSVALARVDSSIRDGVVILETASLAGGMFSAQLVPQIAALLKNHAFTKADIAAFMVVSGPGSFTGLRVGLAAIKALAEILQKPIVPVSLLEVVARMGKSSGKMVAVLEANRNEVYFGAYEIDGESVKIQREETVSEAEFLSAARGAIVVTPHSTLAAAARGAGLSVLAVERPGALEIAGLGLKKLQAGETVSPEQLEANYMRRSDATLYAKPPS